MMKKNYTIGIFTDTFRPQKNGVVVFLESTLPLLARRNKVILFAPGEKKFKMEKVNKNLRIYWIPAKQFPFYEGYRIAAFSYFELKRILKKEKVDVVHCHAPMVLALQGLFAAKGLGIPTVSTYHTHLPDYVPHLLKGRLPNFLNRLSHYPVKKMIKHVYSASDCVTGPTAELVQELHGYGIHNVKEVPLGVDAIRFKNGKKYKKLFMKKYNIQPNLQIILYAGRVSFEKRLEVLLHAFKKIESKNRLLLIVGDGPYKKKYCNLARRLGIKNILFTGFVEDKLLPAAYACADVFVSPSDTETFGLVFTEAMAAGVPVIGVNRLGAAEVVRHCRNGYLVKPGDYNAMAMRMTALLADRKLRKQLGAEGRKTAGRYSLANCVGKMGRIYQGLVKSKGLNTKKYKNKYS